MTWDVTCHLKAFVVILQVALVYSDENGAFPGFTQQPSDTIVRSRNQTILCTVRGESPLQVTWLKDGQIIDLKTTKYITIAKEGALNIHFTNRQRDEGSYRCVVENKYGRVFSRVAKLTFPYMNEFSVLDSRVIINEGEKAYLPCHAPDSYPDKNIYWSKLKNGGSYPLQLERNSHYTTNEDGNLYFSYTQDTDSGVYYCSVENNNLRRVLKRTIVLRMEKGMEKNIPPEVWKFDDKIALKGSNTIMECIAYGRPIPVMIFRNANSGNLLSGSKQIGNRLRYDFSKFERKDEGLYSCELSNTYGQTASKTAYLKMESKPELLTKSRSETVAVDSVMHFSCVATVEPSPTYKWFFNGNMLKSVNELVIHNGNLTILKVMKHHDGFYQCIAHNKHGEDIMTIHFQVIEQVPSFEHPSIPPSKITRTIVGGAVEIHCVPRGAPTPTLTWIKSNSTMDIYSNERFSILSTGTLRITDVKSADEGQYECIAKNKLGTASATGKLLVTDGIAITDVLTKHDEIIIGQTMILNCKTNSVDQVEVVFNWYMGMAPNKIRLRNRGRIVITRKTSKESQLLILNVNERDSGIYTCEAIGTKNTDSANQLILVSGPNGHKVPDIPSGPHGSQTTTVPFKESTKLSLIGPPDPPMDVTATEMNGLNVKISWTLGRERGSPITKIYIEVKHSFDEDNWYLIKTTNKTLRDRESEIVELSPWVEYEIRVIAENKHGLSKPSPETVDKIRTPTSTPTKYPTSIEGNAKDPNSIMVSFKPLDPIDQNAPGIQYIVYYREKYSSQEMVSAMVEQNKDFVVLTFQSTDSYYKPYEFQVQAKNDDGYGPRSPIYTANTGERTPLVAPTKVNVQIESSTSAVSTWEPVDMSRETMRGKFAGYKFLYWLKPEENHPRLEQYVSTHDTTATITLRPHTEYYFQVLAFNNAGDGPGSQIVGPLKTPEGKPSMPSNFKVTDASQTRVTLNWSKPIDENGNLLRYIMTYQVIPNGELKNTELSTDQTFTIISNLSPNSIYLFKIAATTSVGIGEFAEIQFDLNKIPTTIPMTPVVGSIGHHAIVLTWKPIHNEQISGYKIFYWRSGETSSKSVALWERGDDIITTIQNLQPDTLYYFRIAVVNKYGTGPSSEIVEARTNIDKNAPPVPTDGKSTSSSSITLQFSNYIILVFLLIAILIPR